MSRKFDSQPSGVVVIERLTNSPRKLRRYSPEPDATLTEFLAYLTEPDALRSERTPSSAVPVVSRLRSPASHASPRRLAAELPKLASELDNAWRRLRRRIKVAARLTA